MGNGYFSIVIPAYNCSKHLEQLLPDLVDLDYPKDKYEVLVVDDGSQDSSAACAKAHGVRVIAHDRNLGRVITRETGAKASKHDNLVFIDARCRISRNLLKEAVAIDYLPLMGVGTANKYGSSVERLFYCIRRRVYSPYEPQDQYAEELWLKPDAFDGRPKGTGLLIIDRDLFLSCALSEKSQDVSDDTRLLKNIVQKKAILRHTRLSFFYEHRQDWRELLKHTFFRGPKFLDYYLSPGGPLFGLYLLSIATVATCLVLAFTVPWLPYFLGAIPLLLCFFTAVYLAEEITDLPYLMVLFPPIAIAFISGIFSAQLSRLCRSRHWIRH